MTHSILWTLYMIFREPYGNVNIVFFWFCQLMVNRNHKTEVQTKLIVKLIIKQKSLKTKIQYLATSRADTPLGTTY